MTVRMSAPADRVWSLVSEVTNTGRFSPETFDAQWLGGATGPALGARFRGHVRRNGRPWLVYWTHCVITRCEPGREFSFDVVGPWNLRVVEWSYRLEPFEGGTDVTESFALSRSPVFQIYAAFAGRSRTQTNINNMRVTLENIKEFAESLQG